jgi:uncharacterized ion transporter superfamily protein YfcC
MTKTDRAGISIGARAFLASFLILLALMIGAGLLTRAIPAGRFDRTGPDGAVAPGSYRVIPRPDYPAWRWILAPVEVLGSPDAASVVVIIAFIAVVGGSFAVLQKAGILAGAVDSLARRFGRRKYLLLALVTLFFMLIGSLMGIFEEVIPLVPVAIALASSLGWDIMTGLGMSILATGFGFAAAISNPFSIGTAQRLAGVPVFSGSAFRVLVFVFVYALYVVWLLRTARRSESASDATPAPAAAAGPVGADEGAASPAPPRVGAGIRFFAVSMALIVVAVMVVTRIESLRDYSMPITALLFLVAGLGSGLVAGLEAREAAKAFGQGVLGILPGVVLILMAVSVKRIVVAGGIMDTILEAARRAVEGSSGYAAAALVYLFTLSMNFFIGSATAKAFLLMPILAPLADLSGLSRQIVVQAYAFGDGFSNMLYPTNAVLLISLGIAGLSWPAWFKRTWALQLGTLVLTFCLLMLAVSVRYR